MKIGSLCSGYGGLDLAVEHTFGAETVWHAEIDSAASKVLATRWPGVPNLGDLTAGDWASVEPVDILTAGYPCQPFSAAGRRKGADDERHLWPHVREAVRRIRPRLAVLENVAGHRSLGFDRVLGDLAEDGMHVRWTSLRAADVGACHGRSRVFILATDAASDGRERVDGGPSSAPACSGRAWDAARSDGSTTSDTASNRRDERWPEPARLIGGSDAALSGTGPLIPTPRASDAGPRGGTTGFGLRNWARDYISEHLLPTPTSRDHKGQNQRGDDTCLTGALLPTPSASDGDPQGGPNNPENRLAQGHHVQLIDLGIRPDLWGKYEPAIRRWEHVTRPAPSPTEPNTRGKPRLSPRFSEWMMGLPDGWVTDIDISRNNQLKIIGNGVVPQQACAALAFLLSLETGAVVA